MLFSRPLPVFAGLLLLALLVVPATSLVDEAIPPGRTAVISTPQGLLLAGLSALGAAGPADGGLLRQQRRSE